MTIPITFKLRRLIILFTGPACDLLSVTILWTGEFYLYGWRETTSKSALPSCE